MLRLELPGMSTEFQDSTNRARSPSSAPPGVSRLGRTLVCSGIRLRFSLEASRALVSMAGVTGRFFLSLAKATNWPLCSGVRLLRGGALTVVELDSVRSLRTKSRELFCLRSRITSSEGCGGAASFCDPADLAGEEAGCCCCCCGCGCGCGCCCCCCCCCWCCWSGCCSCCCCCLGGEERSIVS